MADARCPLGFGVMSDIYIYIYTFFYFYISTGEWSRYRVLACTVAYTAGQYVRVASSLQTVHT